MTMAIEAFIDALADETAALSEAPFHEASDVSSEEVAVFLRACQRHG